VAVEIRHLTKSLILGIALLSTENIKYVSQEIMAILNFDLF